MRGETGSSSFKERERRQKLMAFSEGVVAEIGRACLLEVSLKRVK